SGAGSLSAASIINNGAGVVTVKGDVAVTDNVNGTGTTNVGTTANGDGTLTANRIIQSALMIGRVPTTADPTPSASVTINASNPSNYISPGDACVPTGDSSGTSILTSLSIANDGTGLVMSPVGPSAYYGKLDLQNN